MPKPRAGLIELPRPRDMDDDITTIGRWAQPFLAWVVPLCRLEKIEWIVAEAPLLKLGFGENKTMTTRKTLTIAGLVGVAAVELGIRAYEMTNREMITHWLGKEAVPLNTDARKWLSRFFWNFMEYL